MSFGTLPCADDEFHDATLLSEPWCADHGYGCEPQNCPCGHSLRCDCVSIQNEH